MTDIPRPFVKWVGGKRQLLPELQKRMPDNFRKYVEPFVGGGALLWTLNPNQYDSIIINDYNSELINLYKVVKTMPDELIEHCKIHENTEEYYYRIRDLDRMPHFKSLPEVERASRFLYLNKTCYNGLWRVNKKGQNNVPFGKYKNPKILDEKNIYACSEFLNHPNVTILNEHFDSVKPYITKDSFVYLDPPYAPLYDRRKKNFVGYVDKGFSMIEQIKVYKLCKYIDEEAKGKFMLSNSSSPFIYGMYCLYNIETLEAKRNINCKGNGRGAVEEVIVRNF